MKLLILIGLAILLINTLIVFYKKLFFVADSDIELRGWSYTNLYSTDKFCISLYSLPFNCRILYMGLDYDYLEITILNVEFAFYGFRIPRWFNYSYTKGSNEPIFKKTPKDSIYTDYEEVE